ncbi:glycoside hydrolase family 71/99-like protein [Stigmatella aurantiaca]|uniref:Xylosidase/arabinosidase n=1 Tax=Stigmatella aurantiaca (strain DW4/3-1) TaxID=378806 RepID=Q08T85_STIAD|nr:glycoside hydrolase family 71/99-like protein [Stigmatella aurantiaca]EAU63689.1 xylosidase/arabinosidase [Stigmatella aurantiaca DW4/3-1]
MTKRRSSRTFWTVSLSITLAGCLEADETTSPPPPETVSETRQAAVAQGIRDKVIVGYQGWFTAYGDGSPTERWSHWSAGVYRSNEGVPSPGHQTFDLYPDISEYAPGSLFQTGYAPLGNGTPAKLFSSYPSDVVNKHFQWMQQYGIDGAAVQRFLTTDGVFMAHRDSVASKVRTAAEATGRLFYIMYDVSGLSDATFLQMVKDDWTNRIVGQLQLPSSSRYATQDGKPVVSIWGLGFTDRPGSAAQASELIDWFRNQGAYVIGGVPTHWRTSSGDSKPGFTDVYKKFHMISPWTVGRYSTDADVDHFKNNNLLPDLAYCNTQGQAYQPVMFPGFAWYNWNGGAKNLIPRRAGALLWKQATNIRAAGIPAAYIAMFDEYDEGTAIAKAAEDSSMAPTNQYFLTLSSDGTYLSSDFYLRLAGKVTRLIQGLDAPTPAVPIPPSNGPVWFRTGGEETDAALTWTNTIDPSGGGSQGVTGYGGTGSAEFGAVSGEQAHSGSRALRITGRDTQAGGASFSYFKAYDVHIPVLASTRLSFWTYPQNNLSRHVTVDLVMTDGSTLRDSGATDLNGVSMHPGADRGTVNVWTQTKSQIGQWLAGKTIDRILITYDYGPLTGDFRGFIDDIEISN